MDKERLNPQERTGVFTSGVVSTKEGRKIALFFTGQRHAGENLAEVLKARAAELETPIQMCDALSRNMPEELKVIVSNCIAHSRRKFVDVVESFPSECRYVLETLGKVYKIDARARKEELSAQGRLELHRRDSGPLMEKLHRWLKHEIEEKRVEPNSGLGEAITYALNHWEKLTRFLEVPGAPLDNNVCERALKKAILHRKGSLFFKTQNGARVGDTFMSLIYTCQLQGVDPFDYLNALQSHAEALAAKPKEWMPWSYKETLARLGASQPASGDEPRR
jgi:hypothetical protein